MQAALLGSYPEWLREELATLRLLQTERPPIYLSLLQAKQC